MLCLCPCIKLASERKLKHFLPHGISREPQCSPKMFKIAQLTINMKMGELKTGIKRRKEVIKIGVWGSCIAQFFCNDLGLV